MLLLLLLLFFSFGFLYLGLPTDWAFILFLICY
jgi:hypothetical protein